MSKDHGKIERILGIYTKLQKGLLINKSEEALLYRVNERTIQRDIDDIRHFFSSDTDHVDIINSIIYDHIEKGYRLEQTEQPAFTNGEVLAICKILLDSRAFPKDDMKRILDKLISHCVPKKSRALIVDLIQNETFHYVEPRHKTHFIDQMWEIGQSIRKCQYIEIDYERIKDKTVVKRKVKPVAIMFSEYYFYMAAFIDDEMLRQNFDVINDAFPTIYRIDRIRKMKVLDERFHIPYSSRFEEGEFRKRIQFMYGGKIRKVKFKYYGYDVDSVLDRLPTAQIICEEDGVYTMKAEVFGKGIDMWLRSQGDLVEIIQ